MSLPNDLPDLLPWRKERLVAISAVRRACIVTQKVYEEFVMQKKEKRDQSPVDADAMSKSDPSLVRTEVMTKGDESPVTVGDYAAQAVIASIIGSAFPSDPIVGEEDAAELRKSESKEMLYEITNLVNLGLTAERLSYEREEWKIGERYDIAPREVRNAIDRGNYNGGGSGRMWTIDPIDGTKGFLRGQQYAVCLALIVDGKVTVSVIGCPNLPHRTSNLDGPKGFIFAAVKNQGSERLTMEGIDDTIISMPSVHNADLIILESVETGHSSLDFNSHVAEVLEVTEKRCSMDSQAKYCALAMGRGHLYLRIPARAGYEEKIWDHAPGSLLVEEAGGIVTDVRGNSLDFTLGKTLQKNCGIVACSRYTHKKNIETITAIYEKGRKVKSREVSKAAAPPKPEPDYPPPRVPRADTRDGDEEKRRRDR